MRQFVRSAVAVLLCLVAADSAIAQFDRGSSDRGRDGFDRSRFGGFDRGSSDRGGFDPSRI